MHARGDVIVLSILTTWKSRSPHATTSLPFPRCSVRWILPPRNDDTSSKPHHSAPRTVRPRAGSRSLILGESKLPDAEIRFCGSTNARPTTPRDGCDGRKANFHDSRTNYVWMTYPLSNLSAQITSRYSKSSKHNSSSRLVPNGLPPRVGITYGPHTRIG